MQLNRRPAIAAICFWLTLVPVTVLAQQNLQPHNADSTSLPLNASPLLLTGQIISANSQAIMVPKAGDMWRYQIQWMLPEGTVAKPGQIAVIFDKSAVANRIEQLEASLLKATAEEQSQSSDLDAKWLQAEFDLKEAELNLEKAELDAAIPTEVIPAKEYAENQFERLKADLEVSKKRQALKEAAENRSTLLLQIAIDKQRSQLELAHAVKGLEQLQIKANFAGTIIHARDPRKNKKIAVGDAVMVGSQVAMVRALDELEVIAWVNEVDVDRLVINAPVNLSLDADATVKFKGSIQSIGNQASKKAAWGSSNWFPVEIQFTRDEQVELIPGMSVLVEAVEKAS